MGNLEIVINMPDDEYEYDGDWRLVVSKVLRPLLHGEKTIIEYENSIDVINPSQINYIRITPEDQDREAVLREVKKMIE